MPQYLNMAEASARLPGRPHRNTVQRWMLKGSRGIKLRSARFCGRRVTTEEWINEFVHAQTSATDGVGSEHLKASAELSQLGI